MEKSFVILPDITCDLNEEIRKEYDIEFVPGHFTTDDGKDHVGTLTWDFSDRHAFYDSLRKNPNCFTTSPANSLEFAACFEKYAKAEMPVICLTISSKMSGTYKFACNAKNEVLKKYPDAKIEVIDSLMFSASMGLFAVNASILRSEGKSFEETVKILEETKLSYHQMGWLDDLAFTAKKGRINNSAAFFGTLLGIKPLGDIDTNGMTTVVGKAKGEKAGFNAIINYVKKTVEDEEKQTVIICHTDRPKEAEKLRELVSENFRFKQVLMTTSFPSCGINIGSGLVALYYTGAEVSENLVKEKAIMQEILNK